MWILIVVGVSLSLYFQWDVVDVPMVVYFVTVPAIFHRFKHGSKITSKWWLFLAVFYALGAPVVYVCVLDYFGIDRPTSLGIIMLSLTALATVVVGGMTDGEETEMVDVLSSVEGAYFPSKMGVCEIQYPKDRTPFHEHGEDFDTRPKPVEIYLYVGFVSCLNLKTSIEKLLFITILILVFEGLKKACYCNTNMWKVRLEPEPICKAWLCLITNFLFTSSGILVCLQRLQGFDLWMTGECIGLYDPSAHLSSLIGKLF